MKKRGVEHIKVFLVQFLLIAFAITSINANISGIVYKDFNLNGQKDANDVGVVGATVSAVCEDLTTPTTTTDASGTYTITVSTAGDKCRVEVNASHIGMTSAANAQGATPLVDVVSDGQTHNVSVASSSTFCQANPGVVLAALPGGVNPDPSNEGTLFNVILPNEGEFNNNGTIDTKRTKLSTLTDTGAVWGLAYKKSSKEIFAAANLKRYVDLKNNNAGAIYKLDNSNNVTLFSTIPNVGYTLASRDLKQNKDKDIIPLLGRAGLGDLDISEDETKLYVVNMANKSLVTINSVTGAIEATLSIPNPYGGDCPNADVRPWALKVVGNDVLIGSICESKIEEIGSTNNDNNMLFPSNRNEGLGASIQKFNGAIFQEIARTNSLRYLKSRTYDATKTVLDNPKYSFFQNHNWSDIDGGWGNNILPILTDIELSNKGDLILGYTDRAAWARFRTTSSGDIRKMCLNPNGSYTDETTAISPTNCATHIQQYDSNPEKYYEFYSGDNFQGATGHPETAAGAMAQLPGGNSIIVAMVDATDWNQPGGLGLYSHDTGEKIAAQAVIKNTSPGERQFYAGKAGGVGDIELLCDSAPIEVGNLVWEDSNNDGIQDPEEPALSGIPVSLTCNGTLFGIATTDASGHYYFGGPNNANLTGDNTITAGKSCILSIAQADVNGKEPSPEGASADDIRDNDAVASGTNNEISFTTGVNSNHSFDFGIQSAAGCAEGTLFQDNNNDGILDAGDTAVPAGITVTITDKNSKKYPSITDAQGKFQIVGVTPGNATVAVDVTDTDITSGAVWSSSSATVTIVESAPGTCGVQNFPFTLPAPIDFDPKEVATCAKATSLTWKGSTRSRAVTWTDMLATPLTTMTRDDATNSTSGIEVGVTMSINNPNNKFYDTTMEGNTTSGSGTSAAFGEPYLTLYLGNQATSGNGTFATDCAVNGYALQTGDKVDLVVEFDQAVVLDNWRIRDVDSGNIRDTANWEWQDGITVVAEDANGNPVNIETKIGTAGAGLIKDANGIVHTDKDNYDAGGGNFIAGIGTTPNATNGHIVLTSNFMPVKKITIIHSAGPDIPCQTRSALAMEGFAVCVPLHISGTIYADPNGAKPVAGPNSCDTSDGTVNGTKISFVLDENNVTKPLYVQLTDENGKIIDVQPIKTNGTYYFDKNIKPNSTYKVLLTDKNDAAGASSSAPQLPSDYNYEGENLVGGALDVTVDGMVSIPMTDVSVDNIDFGINKSPLAQPYTKPAEINPGGTTAVALVPAGTPIAGFIQDLEETTPNRIKMVSVPSSGTLFYNANPVAVGDIIDAPDVNNFTYDPEYGDVDAAFTYVAMDKACRKSQPALLKASFSVPNISGKLFLDTNGDQNVNGNETANSCDNTTALYINLIRKADDKIVASVELAEDGSYAFYNPDVQANTSYDLLLSQTKGMVGDAAPSADLPAGCMNVGENNGDTETNAEGTLGNGRITVNIAQKDIPELNFGISPTVKIGNQIWIEDDNDGDATTGTVTYPPIGTVVTATDANGNTYTGTIDATGKYSIDVPANAIYTVTVATLAGTAPTAGSDDSDVADTTSENNKSHNGKGTTVTVGTVDNMTLDFGFYKEQTASIGNLFWIDDNANGKVDSSEKGVNGVKVELLDKNGTVLETQRTRQGPTNELGYYLFENLTPDKEYQVHFDYSDIAALNGYVFSSNVEQNNGNNAKENGITRSVVAQVGTANLSLDAGVNCGCSGVSTDSSDSLGVLGMFAMMLMTLVTALLFVRKEEEQRA